MGSILRNNAPADIERALRGYGDGNGGYGDGKNPTESVTAMEALCLLT